MVYRPKNTIYKPFVCGGVANNVGGALLCMACSVAPFSSLICYALKKIGSGDTQGKMLVNQVFNGSNKNHPLWVFSGY